MKRVNKMLLGLIGATILSAGLYSCSNDDTATAPQTETASKLNGGIEQEMENIVAKYGGTIDFKDVNKEEAYQLSSMQEFNDIMAGIYNSSREPIMLELVKPSDRYTIYGCADGIYHGSANAGMASINFWVTVTDGKITAVNSGLSGLTLGLGWSQNAASFSGNRAVVSGTYSGNFFWEGIGSVWGSNSSYIITLPC